MTTSPGPVTAADVRSITDAAIAALRGQLDKDWQTVAGDLAWTVWETIDHMSDDLFAYAGQLAPGQPPLDTHVPFGWRRQRPDGPALTIFADPQAGQEGQLQVLDASAAFLVAMVRTASPDVRAHHIFGPSDPEGFAAMGVVEVGVHMKDVADGLGMAWSVPPDLCDRVLFRLFPEAPADADRWATLLWVTGRAELPGRERLQRWRWWGEPRAGAR